jgi:hypothetical protein
LDRLSPSIFRRPPPSRTSSFSLVPSGLITDNENEMNEWPALIYDPCDMSHERILREFFLYCIIFTNISIEFCVLNTVPRERKFFWVILALFGNIL